ncbi:MAG: DHH family phosphoesterase [Erysipelotrichaceae bacterium]
MKNELIPLIEKTMKMHYLDSVSIFCNKQKTMKSIGAALALSEFLNSISIPSNVIIENTEKLSLETFQPQDCKINPLHLISNTPLSEHFLAICVDCKRIYDIESTIYQESFVLMNIFGPLVAKGFGVLNFIQKDVSCSAEIIYKELKNYCIKANKKLPVQVANYLYLSLLTGTKQFSANIKKETFLIAKELLNEGADYHEATYAVSKKSVEVLKCQEVLLKEITIEEHIAYVVLDIETSSQFSTADFAATLEVFQNIGNIYVWVIFLERENRYDVILESNSTYKYNVGYVAKKNNGTGEITEAYANIEKTDISKLLGDVKLLIKSERGGHSHE